MTFLQDTDDMQKTQRAMKRVITGVRRKDRVSNKQIRGLTKVVDVDIGYILKIKKFQNAGHLIRGGKE